MRSSDASPAPASAARPGADPPLQPGERRALAALLDLLFPPREGVPGAVDIGALAYLEAALLDGYAAHLSTYRAVLAALAAATGGDFAAAADDVQRAAVGRLEAGGLDGLVEDRPGGSFTLVMRHLREGLFGDPSHAGNRDFQGWRLLGFPGAQPGYGAAEQELDAPVARAPVGLDQLPKDMLAVDPAYRLLSAASADLPAASVVIVGGGAVGLFLAHRLVLAGETVTVLEAGPSRTGRERRMDEISSTAFRNEGGATKFNGEVPTWRRRPGERAARATRSQGLETALGGNSVAWGAVAMRFYADDFRPRSRVEERYGGAAIPDGTTVADWPLCYADLAPFYQEAENLLGVSGLAYDAEHPDRGGNPFDVPRRAPYPMPPLRTSGLGRLFADAAAAEGYHPFPLPAAINSEPHHGRAACTYCSFCSRFGCHVDAKASAQNTVLAEALATGRLAVLADARVTEIVTDDRGAAVGARYVLPDGSERIASAPIVVVATYTFENVRLLLRSVSPRHPRGLGNDRGQVGLHYITRQQPALYGVFDRELNRFIGPTAQAMAIADLSADHFDHAGLGFVGGGRLAVFNQYLPIEASAILPPDVPRWGAGWRDFFLRSYRRTAMLFIDPEILSYDANRLDLDPEHTDAWGFPVTRITFDIGENERLLMRFLQDRGERILGRMGAARIWRREHLTGPISTHDVGGTRMGNDPRSSVVDSQGRVHDTPGLVVLGGSVFVSLPSVNPLLTILAIALRAGDMILGRAG